MRPIKRAQWFGCWLAYKAWLWLPMYERKESLYGHINLWLLGYAGAYAHSEDFTWFCEQVKFR